MGLWILQCVLCAVLFAATAYAACRDRPVGDAKRTLVLKDDKRSVAFTNVAPMRRDSRRARGFVHKRILWMCGVWVLFCAPIVAFSERWHLNWRSYVLSLQVCLLLGFSAALGAYNRLAGRPRLLRHQTTALAKRNRATLKDVAAHGVAMLLLAALCIWLGRRQLWVFVVSAILLLGVTVWYYRQGLQWVDVNAVLQDFRPRHR